MKKFLLSMFNLDEHILYEDNDYLVINKPAMLHSVMLQNTTASPSLAALLAEYNKDFLNVSDKPEDVGLLQRLDFETSGCILGAKNKNAWQKMFASLKAGKVHKTYLAIVEGLITEKKHIETFIGAKGRHSQKVKIFLKEVPRSLPAVSNILPVYTNEHLNLSLVSVSVPSARRHQVRAHLAYLGFPLLGDKLYGAKRDFFLSPERTFFLHANTLNFKQPFTEKEIVVSAPTPACLEKIMNN